MDMNSGKLEETVRGKKKETETVRDREAWHAAVPEVVKSQDWATKHRHHLYAESKR